MPGIAVIKPALLRFQLLWQGSRPSYSGALAAFVVVEGTLGCVSALSTCRTRVLMLSLAFLCVFTPLDGIPLPSGVCLSRMVSCRELLPVLQLRSHPVTPPRTRGCHLVPGKSSPPSLVYFSRLSWPVLSPAFILPRLWFRFECQVR